MLNSSFRNFSNLNELLIEFGFDEWKTLTASFLLPIIGNLGVISCSVSTWVFFRCQFKDPVFFYYRLLCLVYVIHLLHDIPFGLFISPKYISNLNTYACSIYIIFFGAMANFLYHYEDTLQMAILLTHIKIFNSFVKKHFSASPQSHFFLLVFVLYFVLCLGSICLFELKWNYAKCNFILLGGI